MLNNQATDALDIDRHPLAIRREARRCGDVILRTGLIILIGEPEHPGGEIDAFAGRVDNCVHARVGHSRQIHDDLLFGGKFAHAASCVSSSSVVRMAWAKVGPLTAWAACMASWLN